MTQDQALAILKTGANVFLTGEPGSGKTHTINAYVAYLKSCDIEPAITASTGIAATHIGGLTIHSWSGIGIIQKIDKYALDRITSNEYVVRRIDKAKVLIIDEVSMLSADTLDAVESVCREVRRNPEPFGGLQVVLVGDFFQLPPVQKFAPQTNVQEELLATPNARFAFDSRAWKALEPVVCYLTEQHRQDDDNFLSLLTAIRRNRFTNGELAHIEKRRVLEAGAPAHAPKLYSHNVDVDRVNAATLDQLAAKPVTFPMTGRGSKPLVETLKKGCLSPETLTLKVGAAVMFTKNNPRVGYVNGTLGTVVSFDSVNNWPTVETRGGVPIVVEPVEWMVEENGSIKAAITQLPLRLAWAITVHKSQGMSLDEAVVDLRSVFEYGQGYVALSRVRRLAGLYMLGWSDKAFMVHPDILAKDTSFEASSVVAEETFGALPPDELSTMQANFIRACGGTSPRARPVPAHEAKNKSAKHLKPVGKGFEKIREKHPNAYRRWSAEDDAELTKLFEAGTSYADLMKCFGRKRGAIAMRLMKLGLVEAEE